MSQYAAGPAGTPETAATSEASDTPETGGTHDAVSSSSAGSSGASLPLAGFAASFRVLWRHTRGQRGFVLLVALAGLLSAVAGLVAPWAIGWLVDVLPAMVADGTGTAGPVSTHPVWIAAAAVAGAGVVGALCAWGGQAWLAQAAEPTVAGLREAVMDRALRIGSARLDGTETGDLVSRVAEDAREVSQAATTVIPLVVQSLFTVVVSAAGLATVDWRLGLVGLLAIPMYWSTLRWYLPRSGPIYREERAAFGTRASRLLGGITGVRTLRAYDAQDPELERITAASERARDLSIGVFTFVTRAFSRNNRAEAVVLAAILAVGFLLASGGAVTAGAVTTAALLFHRLFNPIGALVGMFDQVQSAGASLNRMAGVISLPVTERTAVLSGGPLELAGVSHTYDDGTPALHDVDLTIAPGEMVAVVGTTGAGKSTLAQIAAGLIEPSVGEARLGGVALIEAAPSSVREYVSMVSQEVHCFATTVAENVRSFLPEADRSAVTAALDAVGAEWVARLPQGLDTEVGEGGYPLDPMQHQMIALARVVLADPSLVVLDEATAEAGSAGARRLDEAAARVLTGRSGLVVAHRLSQAVGADRILVMEGGRVVESGTHDELRDADGRYAELCRAWFGA
ncbi:MAG TPA: ABC transporter ATP-binding protein [Jiangellaceae bacterium]|nr:ABC transporter ATP-binding protein [Jiangellaceae bacterium]